MIQESKPRYRAIGASQFGRIPEIAPEFSRVPQELLFDMRVVASVLPFRVNEHVLRELIRWDDVPNDPIFQLVFPQRGMLSEDHFQQVATALEGGDREQLKRAVASVRAELNPHPAGQRELNMPSLDGEAMGGLQHKYRETVLFFPSQGQTCHAYCSFCFRWAQFVGDREQRFAESDAERLHAYLRAHPEVTDLLVTGGDPLIMKTQLLQQYLEPLLGEAYEHVSTIRLGTKSLTFWPQRFVSDPDADDLLRMIERLSEGGKHVAVMAHIEHWRELDNELAHEAVRRLRDAGAIIRSQAPLLRHVNDSAEAWARTWNEQVNLGIVPYYMFVQRDTGAREYYEVPLERAWHIHRDAIQRCSGLARTARGPSMSCEPGKVEIQGVTEVAGEKVFALRFIQGRNPDWIDRPFFARYDPQATWFDQLRPAFGESEFFFEAEYNRIKRQAGVPGVFSAV